jgi:2-hydroxychromene-2-carboxylate isomerase
VTGRGSAEPAPVLSYDLGSPYAYVASARVASLLGLAAGRLEGGRDLSPLEAVIEVGEAGDRRVRGVPTLGVGDRLFWGDDRLEDAVSDALGAA